MIELRMERQILGESTSTLGQKISQLAIGHQLFALSQYRAIGLIQF
jgi:hypothetical protein